MKPPYLGPANLYAFVLPQLRAAGHACGYAIALHGTMTNDLDLIAIPWTAEAVDAEQLAEALRAEVKGVFQPDMPGAFPPRWEAKPHGRTAISIYLCFDNNGYPFGGERIDLSIVPRQP